MSGIGKRDEIRLVLLRVIYEAKHGAPKFGTAAEAMQYPALLWREYLLEEPLRREVDTAVALIWATIDATR